MNMGAEHHFVTAAVVLFCVACLVPTQALPLPTYIDPCSRSDPKLNDCALKSGRKALPFLLKGDRKYNIPKLDPLEIKQLKLDLSGGLILAANNVNLRGFTEADLKKVTLDTKKRQVTVEVAIPVIEITGQYEVNGKILVLPISGAGDANITLYDALYKFKTSYDVVKKSDGKDYLDIKGSRVEFSPKNAYLYLGNLFNGDKTLGNNMNRFLNDNWQDVLKELGPALSEGIGEVIVKILGAVLENVPYDEIILK